MPALKPIKRQQLIRYLRMLGFDGPYTGGSHQYMVRDQLRLTIPNPHKSDIGVALLAKILSQANISREEWEQL
jgi:predicted RNA binding protein YcfA (HicA-like mRNA interferase family)